eukprot:SAG11_NODE_1611_length_4583_cov_3.380687_7_plen_36_part_00
MNFLCTFLGMVLMDRLGRKTLLISGASADTEYRLS